MTVSKESNQMKRYSLLLVIFCSAIIAAENDAKRIGAWDTGSASADALAPAALAARDSWAQLDAEAASKGDLVAANGLALVVVRKSGAALDLYSTGGAAPVSRAHLVLLAADG